MEKTIQIAVLNKIAVKTCDTVYICGNSDFSVNFTFDEDWAEHYSKTARFIANDGTYVDQPFSGNSCPVPILKNTYGFNVGVYAGSLKTTTPAYCPAKKSILCLGGLPNGGGSGGITQETDPTVPAWAKQPNKPGYTAEEVGAASKESVDKLSEEKADQFTVGEGLQMSADRVLSAEPEGVVELIEEITLSENVSDFKRDTTPGGKPYNFRRIIIMVYKPAVKASGYMWLTVNNTSVTESTNRLASITTEGENERRGWCDVSIVAGRVKSLFVDTTAKGNSAVGVSSSENAFMNVEATSINAIRYNYGNFPEGTTITIYGEWM